MSVLIVPPLDDEPWPSLGGQVCDLIEECAIFGPGSLKGQPAVLDDEKRAAIWRLYEVYPQGHQFAGRRRFKRGGLSWRKGTAKTEFEAWIVYAELHPEGPVRCDGFDASGQPVGVPVRSPYIPMLAYTKDQVEELAFGVLKVVCEEGPDASLFDVSLERVIRLDGRGRADGSAVPLAGSPNAADGARTTFQALDEPHRMYLPRLLEAHETMTANLSKRALEDPWTLYVGTAGQPGQGSVAELVHAEAEMIGRGEIDDPQLFYFHREAGKGFDLTDLDQRIAAVAQATGPAGEYGPGQFLDIARQWDRPGADKSYLERVWLNRWVASDAQAFDPERWKQLADPEPIPDGALVVAGFDGARFRDATAIVLTDLATGRQECAALWERPEDADEWEIPEAEVTAAWEDIVRRYDLYLVYGDPPHWTETYGSWSARWPDVFEEWWTARPRPMSQAVRAYREAMESGAVSHVSRAGSEIDAAFDRHLAAAGRKNVNLTDDDGAPLYLMKKINPERKFDAAMAGCLSWRAYLDAIKNGASSRVAPRRYVPRRIR